MNKQYDNTMGICLREWTLKKGYHQRLMNQNIRKRLRRN